MYPTCCGGYDASRPLYGAHPVFLLASATAAEPAATAARLIGAEDDEIVVVD
jgi:hypothetical protein